VLEGVFTLSSVPKFRIVEAAQILGVSDDTVRRWIDNGQLPGERDPSRRMVIDGAALAASLNIMLIPRPMHPRSSAQPETDSSGW
jgi:excisionase family DNA binding protein